MSRRPALLAAAALAAAGLALSVVLVLEHRTAHAGGASFCAISEYVNCDRVALSRYSIVLGVPVAAWGALGYGLALVLALAGLRPGRGREGWPAGLLVLLAAAFAAVAVVLAGISTLAIRALCILCTASWVTSFALLAAALRAARPHGGARAAVARDLAALRERWGTTLAGLVAGAALVLAVVAAYPRAAGRAASAPPLDPAAAMSRGPVVVIVYSDYECPACASAHAETKRLLAGRTGVQLVRRHFPLDQACNPALKRQMHPGACDLARVGICAEAQGKLEPLEDALFANQQARRPVAEIVRAVGLDPGQLQACLASPETDARLRADVEAGIRAQLKATPSFVVGGRLYSGALPPEALPPRTAAATP